MLIYLRNINIKKLNIHHHSSSLQCHIILQKFFKYADLVLKKHLLFSVLKTVVQFFLCDFFKELFKELKAKIFYNIRNMFTVTLDQFNASMRNKSIN